jgi:4-hydroxythreonine-4-phosphate dehydrogenase
MGDPVGIGPEVVARAVAAPEVRAACRPLVVGSAQILRRAARQCGLDLEVVAVDTAEAPPATAGIVGVLDPASDLESELVALPLGHVSPVAGRASVAYVLRGIDLTVTRAAAGIVTAPINKEAMNLAGFRYAGHTELLAERTGAREAAMMLITGQLRVAHVTTHVAFQRVPDLISAERLATVFDLTWSTLQQLGIARPRIAVAGLNPHAGEHGLFGTQERDVIAPAIESAQAQGRDFSGPWPPDTVFARAYRGQFDAVVAMYHDQGHIAIKMIGFDEGVNVSLGLPIVRTSVDHGTAFDIAGTGIARPVSMIQATLLAAQLATARGLV